jgi:dipeptidyl aminopeptidase/acylaminoacyl peptidase
MFLRSKSLIVAAILLGGSLGLGLTGIAQSQEATPIPTLTPSSLPTPVPPPSAIPAARPSPTPAHPPDGTIERMTLIHETDQSAYYALTYWSDGLLINGFLGRPKSPGKHPAIIHNRGGYDDVGALTGVEIVPYVEAGYVAAASQYRGNGGSQGKEDFGGADVDDVTNLIPLLKSLPDVDPDRIGMFGGSRGGMMAYIALKNDTVSGRHDIKAAVTVGGIADLFMWDKERNGTLASILWLPLIGTTPAQNPKPFQDRSAVYWPDLIDAPILLLHGEADTEVSINETLELADLLHKAGKTAEFVTYPGGDHPLTKYHGGEPDALAWFGYYLGGDGVDRSFAAHQKAIGDVSTWFLAQKH